MISSAPTGISKTELEYTTVEGVCLLVVKQPVSRVVREKCDAVSLALHLVSRSRRCSRSIPRRRDLGITIVMLWLLQWTSTPGAKKERKPRKVVKYLTKNLETLTGYCTIQYLVVNWY